MITKRSFLRAVAGALLGAPIVGRAQPAAGKVWKIGFLGVETPSAYAQQLEELRGGLKDFGYVEGKNISSSTVGLKARASGCRSSPPSCCAQSRMSWSRMLKP